MKCEYVFFPCFAKELSLRSDSKYICSDISKITEEYYLFSDLFEVVEKEVVDISSLSTFEYVEISNITSTEDVSPVFLDYDDRNELNENYFKKIEKGDIITVNCDEILISRVRPYLNKILFINQVNASYYYTSAFIQIRPKVHPKLLFYSLKNVFNPVLNSISRQGKGYPTLNEKDFYLLKFCKKQVDSLLSNNDLLEHKISVIENEIIKLKQNICSDEDIINSIIIKEFNLDAKELHRLDCLKFLSVNFHEIPDGGIDFRDSVRYTKMRLIQQEMIKHFEECSTLDEFLLPPKTRNGWSPDNNEIEGVTKLLGIDSLHFNGILTVDNPKYTNETREDIDSFYVKDGDFYISRGNTVELVALASIAGNLEEDYLFPDIMIKLYVDESKINKQFLAFLFNSIIGRLYFKYASKGKQQTMVKVSSDTIRNFVIPKISIVDQKKIVSKIKKAINAQNNARNKIQYLRKEIDSLIESAANLD